MYDALKERLGADVEYILFRGEGHGRRRPEDIEAGQDGGFQVMWVQADSIKEGLEAEFNWYGNRIGVSKTGTEL